MSSPVSALTFLDHVYNLSATAAPVLSNLCGKCKVCMQTISAHPAVASFVDYVKQEARNVYSNPRCKAGITSAMGSAASLVPEGRPFLLFAQCSAGMTDQIGSMLHAAAAAAEAEGDRTLLRDTSSEVAGQLQEAIKRLPAEPTFSQVCDFLRENPQIVSAPIGKRLVAQILMGPIRLLKKGAANIISQSSRINGGLASCDIFLRIAESWSGNASETTKKIANTTFQLFLSVATGLTVLRNFKNAPGIWNKTKQLIVFGALGILTPTYLTNFGADFSLSMRNLLLLWNYRKGSMKLLCKALVAAMIAGGINGASEYHP